MPSLGVFLKLRRAMCGSLPDFALLMIFTADSACPFAGELPGAILLC